MTRYLIGRLGQTLLSMLIVISIVFFLTRLSGNPVDLLLNFLLMIPSRTVPATASSCWMEIG